jgi:hypothetical protein
MKNLLRAGALALALLSCAPSIAQTNVPQVNNAVGNKVPGVGAMLVDHTATEFLTSANPGHFICDSGCAGTPGSGGDPSYTGTNGSTTIPTTIAVTGGWDGTNLRRFLTDASGRQYVNINGALPLPNGAATSAKQAAPGTAGTPSADVISTQGVDNGRPVITAEQAPIVGGSFNRPADTAVYASGDLVANSTTAGSVVPITITGAARVTGANGWLTGLRLTKSSATLTNATFRVHIFRNIPATITNGDNGVFLVSGVAALHICYVDIVMDLAFTDGAKGSAAPSRNVCGFSTSGSANLYALIEARAAYTPTSAETFTVAAEVTQAN